MALVVVAALLPTGCVRRRLAVRSNPPGALVFVDNQQIGTTPCSVDFTYYGTREIRLIKPGFETLTVNQPIPMPWYQVPPIDFVSDNLLPNQILDHRTVSFDLQPQMVVPTEQLLERADQLRQATFQSTVAPAVPLGVPNTTFVPSEAMPPGTFTPLPTFAPAPSLAPTPTPLPPVIESAPSTFAPSGAAPSTGLPSTLPFAPPALPVESPSGGFAPQPGSPQQGPPLVSPPLR